MVHVRGVRPGAGAAWLPPQAPCRPRDRRQSMHTPAFLELTKHALLVALPGTFARVRYTLAAGPWAAFRFQENELVKHVFAHEICIARNVPEPGASKCPRARRLQASALFCRFSEPSFQMVKACFACPSSSPKALLMGLFLGKQAPICVEYETRVWLLMFEMEIRNYWIENASRRKDMRSLCQGERAFHIGALDCSCTRTKILARGAAPPLT